MDLDDDADGSGCKTGTGQGNDDVPPAGGVGGVDDNREAVGDGKDRDGSDVENVAGAAVGPPHATFAEEHTGRPRQKQTR